MTPADRETSDTNAPDGWINRCVCADRTFAELKQFAISHQCGIDQLGERFRCGRGCGLCKPYLEAVLATGQTAFDPALPPPAAIGL